MTKITWDQQKDRTFETGVDRAVLYFPDGGGVPWNGLISVDQNTTRSTEALYFDGVKFNDLVIGGDFEGTLRAFTYPEEFLEFEGTLEEQSGVYVTGQNPTFFNLSYRTKVGDGIEGYELGYKIHLFWNLTAIPSTKTYTTMSLDDTAPMEFEWALSSVPEYITKYKPTSHIVLDSRKLDPWLLEDLESFLYGNETDDPTLPSLQGLANFIRKWDRIIITDNGDGTWTATTQRDGLIEMVSPTEFQINDANATYLDADTYEISSSEKNEEDIF
jgi:hypothetical protein